MLKLGTPRQGEADPKQRKEKSMNGVAGKANGVAWGAMIEVMRQKIRYIVIKKAIAACMQEGLVVTTLQFHRDLLDCEQELMTAVELCKRVAGQDAAAKCLRFAEAV